jgi:cysteine desulfurase
MVRQTFNLWIEKSNLTTLKPIYLDYNATTPIDPDVLEAMLPFFEENFGNPSSSHQYGKVAKDAVNHARQQVAKFLGADASEVVFTSGGSESNNHAIIGVALANLKRGNHIITSQIEHPSVLKPLKYLEGKFGFRTTYLPVDKYGLVNPSDFDKAITDKTVLVTLMHANNEVGTIEPIEEIGKIAKENGIILHTDAAQSCGKIEVNVNKLKVDLLTVAGHKLYAPKGIGALYVRSGTKLDNLIHGASQESCRRAGTENVPYIIGLGKASDIALKSTSQFIQGVKRLRDKLHDRIREELGEENIILNGHPEKRLPNTLNISICGVRGEELLRQIPEIAASTGSACHAGSTEPSQVLLAMGLTRERALEAIRLSLGRWSTLGEIETVANFVIRNVQLSRQNRPLA